MGQLYEALHVGEFQLSREQELGKQLEALSKELAPLEEQVRRICFIKYLLSSEGRAAAAR